MQANTRYSDQVAVLASIDPASVAPSTVVSAWVSVANYHRVAAYLKTGAMTATSTINASLQQATNSSGAGAKAINFTSGSPCQIAQLLAASNSDEQVILECKVDDLDANNGYCYVALSVTVAAAASILSADVLGVNPRFGPASAGNNASVVQVV
jgi:hypothetical protein